MGWTREVWRRRVKEVLFETANICYFRDLLLGKIDNAWCDFDEYFGNYSSVIMPEYFDIFEKNGFLSKDEKAALLELELKVDAFEKKYDYKNTDELLLLDTSEWKAISCIAKGIFFKHFYDDNTDYPSMLSRKDIMEKYPLE